MCKTAVRITPEITVLGVSIKIARTATDTIAICNFFPSCHFCTNEVTEYKRVIIKGKLLHTEKYSKSVRNNDCCIAVTGKPRAFLVQKFLVIKLCKQLNCYNDQTFEEELVFLVHILMECTVQVFDNDLQYIRADNVKKVIVDNNTLFAFTG